MKVPSAATTAVPSTAPLPSRTVTVAPGSPVPLTLRPSPATTTLPGAEGAVTSATGSSTLAEALPARSVCSTDRVWPPSCGLLSVALKVPSAATTAVPSTLPEASRTVTVAPGSPVPVSVTPSAASSRSLGGWGAVTSAAV